MENKDFYVKSMSYSQLRTFVSNPGEWQNQRLLGIYDNTSGVASAIGTILHKFVEVYLTEGNIENAINIAYKCLYDGEDGKTYLIDSTDIDFVNIDLNKVKEHWKTRIIDFKKTGSNEKILKSVKAGIEAFLSEQVDYGEILGLEKKMEHKAFDIIGGNLKVESPIPFTAISDEICRLTSPKTLMVDGELETLSPGCIFIEDTKFKGKHSDMNVDDPSYVMQAFFNYYCVKTEFGEAPKYITYREIKYSKNTDGSSQHQTVTIPFFGKTFEEYKVYFWRYILETFERIKIIQDRDFLFNVFDMFNGPQEWEKQKAYYLGVPVGQLKSKIAMSQKNKIASGVPSMGDRNPLSNSDVVDSSFSLEDLNTTENRIKVAFQNFGVLVTFEKRNEGYSFDQYLFKTARGVTMGKVKSHLPEIMQALELGEGARIEAPVAGTKFIGIEIPKQDRKFAKLEKIKKSNKPLLPIGIDVNGNEEIIDLSDSSSPHMIVAGKTGSGKSEFLKTAIFALKDRGDIHLFDPKRVGLIKMKKYAKTYYTDIEEIAFQLNNYLNNMYLIYNKLEELGYENIYEANENIKGRGKRKFKDIFIIIDELASLVHDPLNGAGIVATIGQLTNLGRAAGMHLIVATQRPDIKVIPGNIKANISTRICFALASEIDSKVVLDETGAEKLLGKGDMLFKNEGSMQRLQGYYI